MQDLAGRNILRIYRMHVTFVQRLHTYSVQGPFWPLLLLSRHVSNNVDINLGKKTLTGGIFYYRKDLFGHFCASPCLLGSTLCRNDVNPMHVHVNDVIVAQPIKSPNSLNPKEDR